MIQPLSRFTLNDFTASYTDKMGCDGHPCFCPWCHGTGFQREICQNCHGFGDFFEPCCVYHHVPKNDQNLDRSHTCEVCGAGQVSLIDCHECNGKNVVPGSTPCDYECHMHIKGCAGQDEISSSQDQHLPEKLPRQSLSPEMKSAKSKDLSKEYNLENQITGRLQKKSNRMSLREDGQRIRNDSNDAMADTFSITPSPRDLSPVSSPTKP
jgi:RecJ-like exonuclease